MFHDPVFADVLRASEEKLSTLPISFHGPYAQTEHSRPKGTPAYERSMGFYREMLPFAKRLHSSYVVFHHNNCKVLDVDREAMLQTADENLRELTALSRYGAALGLAFQVADDILDATSTTEEMGKTVGKDEKEGKLTYVALYGVDGARQRLDSLTEEAVREVQPVDADGFFSDLARDFAARKH